MQEKSGRIIVSLRSVCLYDFLGIVAMSDSLDRAVNGLRIRHAAISVDKYESGHSINNRLVEAVFFLFFSLKHESIIHCVQHRNGPNTGFGLGFEIFWTEVRESPTG